MQTKHCPDAVPRACTIRATNKLHNVVTSLRICAPQTIEQNTPVMPRSAPLVLQAWQALAGHQTRRINKQAARPGTVFATKAGQTTRNATA
jgi:hypothetical protein